MVRIRAALSLEVPVRLLFQFQTVRQLAGQLDQLREAQLISELAGGDTELEELIDEVTSLSESQVDQWVQNLTLREERHSG